MIDSFRVVLKEQEGGTANKSDKTKRIFKNSIRVSKEIITKEGNIQSLFINNIPYDTELCGWTPNRYWQFLIFL